MVHCIISCFHTKINVYVVFSLRDKLSSFLATWIENAVPTCENVFMAAADRCFSSRWLEECFKLCWMLIFLESLMLSSVTSMQ